MNHCGYTQPSAERRASAATPNGRVKESDNLAARNETAVSPAPLVLPGDVLTADPTYPSQSLLSWIREKERNPVTSKRNVICLASPPSVDSQVEFLQDWTQSSASREAQHRIDTPNVRVVGDYLKAFYHGLPLKLLPASSLRFTGWEGGAKGRSRPSQPKYVGLNNTKECVRIRTRTTETFPGQLNLNDLLDAAISMLPEDAYALLLMVDHNLYETDDDDFACGRAYGGSRVAVVSSARYHPALDDSEDIDRDHDWPASHCSTYVESLCREEIGPLPSRKISSKTKRSSQFVCFERSCLST